MNKGIIWGILACVLVSLACADAARADAGACSIAGSGREGATDTTFFQVPDDTLETAMLFVDTASHPATGGESPPNTTIGPALANRAGAYMDEVSYGKTQLQVQMGTTWLRLSQSSYDTSTFAGQKAMMQEAIQKADTAGFDFSGKQTVLVVAAPGILGGTAAFHASAADGIAVDGTNVRWGATIGDDARTNRPQWPNYGSKVLSHELGHVFGLPDLYRGGAPDFETQHLDAGGWDPMGWTGPGAHLFAWHKQKLGWLGPADMVCVDGTATATVTPLELPGGTKMIVAKTAPSIAYVAEVRSLTGFDSELCDSGGVLIYRVDADGGNARGNGIAPITVMPVYPDEPGDPSSQCAALSNAAFELGPGEPTTFSGGSVSVEILSRNPGGSFTIRMTGPSPAPVPPGGPATGPSPRAKALAKCRKIRAKKARAKCRRKAKRLPRAAGLSS